MEFNVKKEFLKDKKFLFDFWCNFVEIAFVLEMIDEAKTFWYFGKEGREIVQGGGNFKKIKGERGVWRWQG